jgi:glycosyltransferase involved in cell wall biosynthesis
MEDVRPDPTRDPQIAVILPCHNEEAAIAGVVASFRRALPAAEIYVFDNASSDGTAKAARGAGAIVRTETVKGKGNAMRRAFADVDADIYVMADGDGTYDAAAAPSMIEAMRRDTLDMVVGVRAEEGKGAYRPGHVLGNRAFSFIFRRLFRSEFTDILSGYRVLSRRFVKSFPSTSKGFEIELEMSTHAALLRAPVREIATRYGARAEGGESKLNTWLDGARILRRMLTFLRLHRPLFVFGTLSVIGAGLSVALATPVVVEFFETGLVPRLPTAVLSASIMLAAIIMFVVGVILDAQARYFSETKRLAYLRVAPPPGLAGQAAG